MSSFQPAKVAKPETSENDPRFGNLISTGSSPKIRLCGFCSDNGVARNNGRIGAAAAPDEIRKYLYKLTPDPGQIKRFSSIMANVSDEGNLDANALPLDQAQEKLGNWVSDCLEQKQIPVILGGGHETAFGHFSGYIKSQKKVQILNWDAHADVRPLKENKPHSGSPFRQALEHSGGFCEKYVVAGLQRHSLSAAHYEYLQKQNCEWYFSGEVSKLLIERIYGRFTGDVMVTMDMDVLDQSVAPGVSAPATNGLSLDLWLHAAFCAGANPKVLSLDISEMNPEFDRDGQTARVAALTIWHFLKGLLRRPVAEK